MGLKDWLNNKFQQREIAKLSKTVEKIEALEPMFQAMSDDELRQFSDGLRAKAREDDNVDNYLVEAFALVREASVRVLGKRHYPVQLMGGIILNSGNIAEMKTGEGKTLVATLPAYLNALSGKGVHIITVNDYLAKRDRDWMGKIHEFLGLTVGCVTNEISQEERKIQYACDITYGTNNEFGFDYLKDNMAVSQDGLVQREMNYAIIDEVDSILIDEARTPLIISGSGVKSTDMYEKANRFALTLNKETDLKIDEKAKSIILTEDSGDRKAEDFFGIENLGDAANIEISHHIKQAVYAVYMMKKDVDYVVKDGEILIVDENTGRIMHGRRYSNGLHQAIEAKEGLEVRKESQTLATVTLQNYFRLYKKLSGMTGTAKTEEDEFHHIYGMHVTVIPTNKPIMRDDKSDVVMGSVKAKYERVVQEIEERHANGQPLLVGTISIEASELVSLMLKRRGIKHEVLNAKHHLRESEIVAQAGRFGAVTIATNMAGRGTDIVLGGNPEFMAIKEMRKLGYDENVLLMVTSPFVIEEIKDAQAKYQELYNKFEIETSKDAEKVKAAGGLCILGTERHESRRIDNQLRGRAGRQGDVGSTQFFVSLEDDLMRLFMSDRMKNMITKLGLSEDAEIEAGMVSKSIESAQRKVEARNFDIRKDVLQYDDVMNKQREIIYGERRRILMGENVKDHIWSMVEEFIDQSINSHFGSSEFVEDWNIKGFENTLHEILFKEEFKIDTKNYPTREEVRNSVLDKARQDYDTLENLVGEEKMREIERFALLQTVDNKWIDHIDAMDQLEQGIGLRAIGQINPIQAYQTEGFDMFDEMIGDIKEETIQLIFHADADLDTEVKESAKIEIESHGKVEKKSVRRKTAKISRNAPCPCGSGKKYKKCCYDKSEEFEQNIMDESE